MDFLLEHYQLFVSGFITTVEVSAISMVVGFFLAIPVALMRLSRNRVMYSAATGFVFFFRGTPLLAQLYLVYYGSGQFVETWRALGIWWFLRSPWNCALLTLTLNSIAYVSEIWRGGIQGVPKHEIEAGKAYGLSVFQRLRYIIVPRALSDSWPAYTNEVIYQIQGTSLISLITISDITGTAYSLALRNFTYYQSFLTAAALYLVIVYAFLWVARRIEERLHGYMS